MEELIYQDRHGTDCVKWDILGRKYQNPDLLSMWIADMDFRVPECVTRALRDYVESGIYGYYLQPRECQQAFIDWQRTVHDTQVDPAWLRFSPGAVSGLHLLVSALSAPGDAVAIMPPVYPAFFSVPEQTGRRLVTCPLKKDGQRYGIDFAALEACFRREQVRMLIHCSPHNPVGRVWTREEQLELLALCRRHGVFLLSDEVHQDLLLGGNRHYPMCGFPEYTDMVACVTSPAKTFNLAGCQATTMIVPGAENRERLDAVLHQSGIEKGSAFASIAYRAAYSEGRDWLNTLLEKVGENEKLVRGLMAENAPGVSIPPLEGTYLLWLDFTGLVPAQEMKSFIERESGLAVNYGSEFGGEACACCIRMNLATSTENVSLAALNLIGALRRRGVV